MPTRTRTRSIVLSAAFVGLAAGGTAACDSAPDTPDSVEENHTFYCTTQDGVVVDEDKCDDDGDGHGGMFFLWHSSSSAPALRPGQKVPAGGKTIPFNDKAARTSWGLPATGKVSNGSSVKVNVVGKGGAPVGAGDGAKAGG